VPEPGGPVVPVVSEPPDPDGPELAPDVPESEPEPDAPDVPPWCPFVLCWPEPAAAPLTSIVTATSWLPCWF